MPDAKMPDGLWDVIVIWSKEGTICGRFVGKSKTRRESEK
jgi:hypothetical protein